MRTKSPLDDDALNAAKSQAQGSGKSLGEVLSEPARRGLRASGQGTQANGLPVFKVRSNSKVIPSSRAKYLLGEDAP